MKIKSLNPKIAILSLLMLCACAPEDDTNNYNTNTQQNSQSEQRTRQDNPKVAPFAVASITGCGYGFKVDMTLFALPSNQQLHYQVWDASGTILIDEDTVSQGMNTNWILSPCTDYQFKFWGWPWAGPLTGHPPSQVITGTTDGCGNIFIC